MEPTFFEGHKYPIEIIRHAVYLYHRFSLNLSEVKELHLERGIQVSREGVQQWYLKFAHQFTNALGRRKSRPGSTWHLAEMILKIKGKHFYLRRAVDENEVELEILVKKKRDKKAVKLEPRPSLSTE